MTDPFRGANQASDWWSDEAAFKEAMFERGDYQAADRYLKKSPISWTKWTVGLCWERLLAYTLDQDFNSVDQKTLETGLSPTWLRSLREFIRCCGSFLTGAAS